MALIVWGPTLQVGIKIIDQQHKGLIDLINRLNEAMAAGKGKTVLGEILQELIRYTQTHFATEERLMSEHPYESAPTHKAEHSKFMKTVGAFKSDFESGNAAISVTVLNFLCDWLKDHIQHSDKKFGRALASSGVK
jgi:hemerythrin